MSPAADRIRALLDYSPETGAFQWRARQQAEFKTARAMNCWNGRFAGKPAGNWDSINKCVRIGVDGKNYKAHRLAWLYVTGAWPADDVVDHRDRDGKNNRFTNLRDTSFLINNQNVVAARADSTTGLRGVSAADGGFRATIRANHKQRHIGSFRTLDEAHAAYMAAKQDSQQGYFSDS